MVKCANNKALKCVIKYILTLYLLSEWEEQEKAENRNEKSKNNPTFSEKISIVIRELKKYNIIRKQKRV